MNRDHLVFFLFLLVFAAVNIYLFASGSLPANMTGLGTFIAAGITLSLYSFLYKDNPLFKFAENLYVGVAAAYTLNQVWYTVLLPDVITPISELDGESMNNLWLLVPTMLGFFMLTQLSAAKYSWLSRIAFAFVVGLGSGLAIPRTIAANLLAQMQPTMQAITPDFAGVNLFIILVGVVAARLFLLFCRTHRRGRCGFQNWHLFFDDLVWRVLWLHHHGASFPADRRVGFLLEEWLVLQLPLF